MRISDWSSDVCSSDLKHLARIEQQFGIERAFQALLLLEIGLGEHHGHQVALFDADAMFPGEDAADLDAQLQYVAAERLCAVELSGDVGVIEDQRVKIAVSRMEHVGDLELILPEIGRASCRERECQDV